MNIRCNPKLKNIVLFFEPPGRTFPAVLLLNPIIHLGKGTCAFVKMASPCLFSARV